MSFKLVFPSAVVLKLSSKTENYAAAPTVGVSTQAKSGNIEPTLYPVALIMIKEETSWAKLSTIGTVLAANLVFANWVKI